VADDALLVEVLMALGKAELVEQILVDERAKYRETTNIMGATEDKSAGRSRIYINPMHHKRRDDVVSTLIHEGIHRARPEWKERSVERAEKRLYRQLSQEQSDAIYKAYRQAVKRFKGVREL